VRTQLGAVVAGAAMVVLVPTAAQAAIVADWEMDEEPNASVMVDSAGGDNNGSIHSVQTGVDGLAGGNAYQFAGTTSWVDVPDNSNLDPGAANITLTATVKIPAGSMADDSYEVVRKGLVNTKGGDWKMEIKRKGSNATIGHLHCVFKGVLAGGGTSLVSKQGSPNVVDGGVHTLQCIKTSTQVIAVVDGKRAFATKAAGSISNNQAVILGSKIAGDDVMQGIVDKVTVDIG
jgi:hypothetical protein